MPKGREVEGYKISPEMKQFIGEYGKVKNVMRGAQQRLAIKTAESLQLKELMLSAEERRQELVSLMPKKLVRGLNDNGGE